MCRKMNNNKLDYLKNEQLIQDPYSLKYFLHDSSGYSITQHDKRLFIFGFANV